MKKGTTLGRPRKTERNKMIVKLVQQGKSYGEIAKMMNLKSRSTVCELFHRERLEMSRK
jgi:transposase